MAETQRTINALLSLLADNVSGDISPEDIRDIVATLQHDHGELYLTTPVQTSVVTQNVWLKAEGTTTLSPSVNHNFDMPVNNRLRFTGAANRFAHIAVSIGVTSAANSKILEFMVAKNGSAADVNSVPSIIRLETDVGSNVIATALHAFIPMAPNDYIEVWGRNTSDATNFTIETLNFVAIGMPAMS